MLRYKGYSLIKPNELQVQRIKTIIEKYNGSIFHEVELNKIVEKQFKSKLFYFVDDPDNINCFSPIHLVKDKFGIKRYNLMPLGDIPYAGFNGSGEIDINQISVGFFESFKYRGFPYINDSIHKFSITSLGETNMVDLSLNEDEIFNNVIHSKRRNMIRKANKSGILTKSFYTENGFEQFWPMLEELHKRLNYSSYTIEFYNEIFNNYAKKKQAFILIAYKDENPISGIFVIGNGNYMHYYKGAGLLNVKNEGQGELLQWEAIRISKSLGVKYYDLCNLEKDKLPAIYRFKTGISRNIIKYPKYTENRIGYKVLNWI